LIGLDYLFAGYFHLASGQIECQLRKAPQIHVAASDASVRYDHSKTQAELDNFENDTISPYGAEIRSHVGGLMAGEVSVTQSIRVMQENWQNLNQGCLYVDKIDVKIHIKPTIYIAREYDKAGCMYRAIMEHEKKHIMVDRMIVNKYTHIIVKGLNEAIKKIGYAQGPFPINQLEARQKGVQQYAQAVLRQYSEQMSEERQRLQQNVDTLEEYERVQAQCRGKK